jgi:hypothetical protein
MAATKCSTCGAPIRPASAVCAWCGSSVELPPAPTAPVPPPSQPAAAPRPTPPGWIRTVDGWAGYSIAHPPEWNARWEGGVITVRQDRTAMVEAMIWPIRLRASLSAQQVAAEFFTWARARHPLLEAWLQPTAEPFPSLVMMRTRGQVGPQRVEGAVSVMVNGSNALISGFHGPPVGADGGMVRELETLMGIVGSFQGEMPVPRQRFREPGEGAFDVMTPVGWQSRGRTVRSAWSTVATCEFSARRDDAGLTQVVVPGDLKRYADGWLMGMCLLGMMGLRPFMDARAFGAELLPRRFKDRAEQRIEDIVECPQVMPRLLADLARIGLSPQSAEISAACVVSAHRAGSARVRQKTFVATARPSGKARWTSPFSGQWVAQILSYYHAPEAEFDGVEPVLAGVADSFQINYDWVQRQRAAEVQMAMILGSMLQQQAQQQNQQMQQQMEQRRHDITHTLHQTSDTIMSGWEERNRVHDHLSHQWSNATLGRADVVDPSYGTTCSVPNDFDQYWRTNSNTLIGGSWGTQPDPSWHKLERINL